MNILDLVIVGSGPGGLTSAIYASRSELNFIVLEELPLSGGQIINTDNVDNYPGLLNISGFELSQKFKDHAKKLGVKILQEKFLKIEKSEDIFKITTNKNEYFTKSVIIATGATHINLNIEGEQELAGRGISYCATCDGAFYKDKEVAIVGGGNSAIEEALYLSKIASKVYLIHRRDEYRANKVYVKKVNEKSNIVQLLDSQVTKIINENSYLGGIYYKNNKTNEEKELKIDGLFVSIGLSPNSELFKDFIELNDKNYIITDENCKTSVDGVYAIGDVRNKNLRQIITACSDGAIAVHEIENYLEGK